MRDLRNTSVVVFTFGILVLGAFCLTACAPPGVRACLDGDRLTSQGKYAQAIEKLKTASVLLPRDPRVWNLLGLAYHRDGQFQNAFAAYQNATARNSNFAVAHYNLGCLFFDQNQFQNAISELGYFTRLEPNRPEGWMKLAAAHLRLRQFPEASQGYINAARLNPDSARALNDLGVVEIQRRRPREALGYLNAALQRDSAYPPALLNRAIVSQRYFTNYPVALQHYREFLKTDPEPASAAAVSQMVAQLERVLAPPPPVLVAQEDPPAAEVPADNAPVLETNAPPVEVVAAPVEEPSAPVPAPSNIVEVVKVPEPVEPKVVPEQPTNRVEVAVIVPSPTTDEPPATAEPQVVSGPEPPPIPVEENVPPPVLADSTVSEPKTSPQEVFINEEPTLPSEDAVIPEARKPLIIPVKPRESKWRILDRLNPVTLFRNDTGTRSPSPASEGTIRDEEQAQEPATLNDSVPSTVAETPKPAVPDPVRRVIRVPSYRYRIPVPPPPGDRARAEVEFSEGLRAHRERRLTDALEAYRDAANLDPSFFEAYYNIGLVAYDVKDIDQSLLAYEVALSLRSDSPDARYNFALSLRRGGYLNDAAHELERVLMDHSNSVPAHMALAKLYADELFQTGMARRHYQRVLELSPQHPQATEIRYWLAAHP